jgi:two-component system sensor histidine kinase ChiS
LAELIRARGAIINDLPLPKLNVNRVQLTQLFQNLVSNAIHHNEKSVTIKVSAEEQGEDWRFQVSDNGRGIHPEHLQKIFEPFMRLVRKEDPGAGLGLAICKKIVESHGGKIWCTSQPGIGTSFHFTLPKALPTAVPSPNAVMKARLSTAPSLVNTPLTTSSPCTSLVNLLLVDDSRADIEITRYRLIDQPHLQCNFLVARDGEEAIGLLQEGIQQGNPVDIVLFDINMPGTDGFEVLEQIRAEEKMQCVKVVMCTGSTYDKDDEKARSLGAVGYLVKPVKFDHLKSILSQINEIQLREVDKGYTLQRVA